MKQGLDRSRTPRTAGPAHARPTASHQNLVQHKQQQPSPVFRHKQLTQQRLDHGYSSPTSGHGGRVRGVGGEDRPHRSQRQDRPQVTPYATGLCPLPHTSGHHPGSIAQSSDLPSQSPRRGGQVSGVETAKQGIHRHQQQHGQDHAKHQHQHCRLRHPQQLASPHHQQHVISTGSVTCSERPGGADLVDSNIYSLATASSPVSVPCLPASRGPSGSSPMSCSPPLQEYSIRGTMCPLTCQVGAGRGGKGLDFDGEEEDGGDEEEGGGGEALSFVFGRPATPGAAGTGRCVSPPASLPTNKRPLSPQSRDSCVPIRRTVSGGGMAVVEREVLSPPPVSSLSPQWGSGGGMVAGGVCCEQCNGCLVDLKRQALRLMFPDNGTGTCLAQTVRLEGLDERLCVPDSLQTRYSSGKCTVCDTQVDELRQEAVAMIRSIQLAQSAATTTSLPTVHSIPALVGSCAPLLRCGRKGKTYAARGHASMPLAAQAQAYLEHNVRAWMNPKKYQVVTDRGTGQSAVTDMMATTDGDPKYRSHPHPHPHHYPPSHHPASPPQAVPNPQGRPPLPMYPGHGSGGLGSCSLPCSPTPHCPAGYGPPRGSSPAPSSCASSPPPNSAAVSFFHRAAQKLSKKKKRQQSQEPEPPTYPTAYGQVVKLTPPPAPPCLLRTVGRLQNPGVGKVKVMLRVSSPPGSQGDSTRFLSVDPLRKQITVFDPSASGYVTSANRRTGIAAPKMFAFDAVFSPDDSLTELCAASLSEMVQAVVSGADGCLFTYGYSKTGKSHSMLGSDQSAQTLGVMPCAVAWLFKLINEQKDKTGARFSVRVSAVEVTGKNENLRDLLADIAQGTETTGVGTAPGVYLREDPICGTQLENQSELRAPTADKAALYLDAALAARSVSDEDEARCSHLLFTLNVYQYRIEKANRAGLPGVAGGRSRLHLIDLGSASKCRDPNNVSLSLSALGNVIMALLNGQRHVPHRDSKISQLLRDSLGNVTCRTCMLAHVSSAVPHYNETLQVIQLAARIHRMKRRRTKFSSTSSEDSSTDESGRFRRPYRGLRMGTLREDVLYSSSHSDPDYTSSSEQSCDTVIYMGATGQSLSDRELTDNEGPPRHVPRTNPRLPRRPSGSRSSGEDSDSGRSRTSDGLYAPRPAMGLKMGTPVQTCSPATLPRPHPVPHVITGAGLATPASPTTGHIKTAHRFNTHSKAAATCKAGLSSGDAGSHWPEKMSKHRAKPLDTAGEQWIDGPGAAIYPESKKAAEQWVDGPPAFLVQSDSQHPSPAPHSPSPHSPSHRGDTARRLKNRKVEAEEQWVDGPREMMASGTGQTARATPLHTSSKAEPLGRSVVGQPNQGPKLSTAVNEKALKQALIKHLEKERSDVSMCVESNVFHVTENAVSRPTSTDDCGDWSRLRDCCGTPSYEDCRPEWDSRQAGDGVSVVDVQQLEGFEDVLKDSGSLSLHRKHHRDHAGKKLHVSLISPKHTPKPSPACSRKGDVENKSAAARLQKSDLPGSASPTHRVAQWIKSVSKSDSPVKGLETVQVTSEIAAITNVTMADAETNTEHDSDFERMADSEGVAHCQEECVEGFCNNTADVNMESSMDTSKDSSTRQDSLYERTVEDRLENLTSRENEALLAKDVDDETFSSMSAREAEDMDREDSGMVQNSKALTEGRQSAKLAKHLAGDGSSAVCVSSLDNTALLPEIKPLLSRKPDGASNPHLNREFSDENVMVSAQYVIGHCAAVCSTAPSVGAKEGSEADSAKGSKVTFRSKPPLPQKTNCSPPSVKANGQAKPISVSSSCSSSGPSAGSSTTSTPKSASSKDSPLLPTQTSPKVSALCVGRKEKSAKGGNSRDKTSGSCSSLSTSSSSGQAKAKSGSGGKLSFLSGFSSASAASKDSKQRKKEKDNGMVGRSINGKYVEFNPFQRKGHLATNDSDSGHDSGVVTRQKRLLSPYATVTQPRTPSHSSSGHGSDNSSTISTEVHCQLGSKNGKVHGGTSSGYESMLRESEGTASSSDHEDSGSDKSDKKKGSKKKGTKRSRSAPARSSESPCSNSGSQGSRVWADPRHVKAKEEPLELKKYEVDDVERLQRRRQDEPECRSSERSRDKGREVQIKQPLLEQGSKPEVVDAAERISIREDRGWGFDCFMCFCKSRSAKGTDV